MKKEMNPETGDVNFHFTRKELQRLKLGVAAAGVLFVVSVGTALYSAVSMGTLRGENQLYQNQLQMAQKKMEAMEEKTKTIEKLSGQLQDMIKTNNNGAGQNMTQTGEGGQGGASTVPDHAKSDSSSSQKDGQDDGDGHGDITTPGELLKVLRKLDTRMDTQLKTMIVLREQLINQTYGMQVAMMHNSTSSTTPDIWPVSGQISSPFGFRSSPGGIGSTFHEGIDIAADYGTPVEATASGVVTQAGWVGGYGYLVEIKHEGGVTTRYGHNSAVLVTVGQEVNQGDVISLIGSTGNSTGPHCHYEVRINGDAVDPSYFLPGLH